jgi:menaquinone-9 beta-reductase
MRDEVVARRRPAAGSTMAVMWDVVVVGAGPAGCSAAAAVLRSRPATSVLLLDRADFPRDKPCGDGIAFEALAALDRLGFSAAGLVSGYPPVRRLSVRSPAGVVATREMAEQVHVVPRLVFDGRLVDQLRGRRGVEIRRHAVRRVDVDNGVPVVDREIRARVVIGADGAGSVVRRAVAPAARPPTAIAIRGYAPEPPHQSGTQVIAMTGRQWPAYAWSFPLGDGTANVGYGELLVGSRPVTRALLLERLCELLPGVDPAPARLRAHHLPLSTGRPPIVAGPVVLAGDAQALINPITGEGIFYAVTSGALAGAAAAVALNGTADAGTTYRRLLRHRLGRHFRHTAALARFGRWPGLVDAGVRAAAADQRAFDELVSLGLADGLVTPGLLARLRWRDRPAAA